jgi:hypothetical protein
MMPTDAALLVRKNDQDVFVHRWPGIGGTMVLLDNGHREDDYWLVRFVILNLL